MVKQGYMQFKHYSYSTHNIRTQNKETGVFNKLEVLALAWGFQFFDLLFRSLAR